MRLSPAAEFAIRGSMMLTVLSDGNPVTLDAICAQHDISKQYLVKLFSQLAKAGIVKPVRGKNGGYLLGKPAQSITLLDIVEAVEGPIALNFCQKDPPECEQEECPVCPIWTEIQDFIRNKLSSVTLAEVAHQCKTTAIM